MAESLAFQDQIFIDHLREALWGRSISFASVMVGAGFSLNATPVGSGVRNMPTWATLIEKLVDDLYPPDNKAVARQRDNALMSTKAASGMQRLPAEYEAAYGRDRLEQRLIDFVPDLSFEPSPLHRLLLTLPWRDVFTTNWDTLLERAVRRLPERGYQIIAAPSELSRSGQPRIVKLHGTIPHVRPFIVTEEDYRSYPDRFAPFVNLVRQGAMECVLCLVGFSGSDPNFLAWTGWVRDQLGAYRPQIFLVSHDNPSQSLRLLLEGRGIRVIDLSRLPGLETGPSDQRHSTALEWFILNLQAGRPSLDPSMWPDPPHNLPPVGPAGLPPIPPASGPRPPSKPKHVPGELTVTLATEWALYWRQTRASYPGWLIAPDDVRRRVLTEIQWNVFRVTRAISGACLTIRLLALRELIWQLDVALVPSPDELNELVLKTLRDVLELSKRLDEAEEISAQRISRIVTPHELHDGNKLSEQDNAERKIWVDPDAIAAAFVELVFVALRRARELGDSAEFDRWSSVLASSRFFDPGIWPRLCYERCLLASGRLEHKALGEALRDWGEDDGGDTYFAIRRAGILGEIGQTTEADRVCTKALAEIRQSQPRGGGHIPTLSREAWALVLFQSLRWACAHSLNASDLSAARLTADECRRRWQEIQALTGSPWDDMSRLEDRMRTILLASRERKSEASSAGSTAEAAGAWDDFSVPLQALRLCDVSGLQARAGEVGIAQELRILAIKRLLAERSG